MKKTRGMMLTALLGLGLASGGAWAQQPSKPEIEAALKAIASGSCRAPESAKPSGTPGKPKSPSTQKIPTGKVTLGYRIQLKAVREEDLPKIPGMILPEHFYFSYRCGSGLESEFPWIVLSEKVYSATEIENALAYYRKDYPGAFKVFAVNTVPK